MIFVTGGTGFLGHHLIPALCRAGFPMRVLTRHPAENSWLTRYPKLEVIHGDLLDEDLLRAAVEGCNWVIHAAGLFRMWGDPAQFYAVNAKGTENLLQASIAASVERFVYVSTAAVAGLPAEGAIIDEAYPPAPFDPYQQSKLDAEHTVLAYYQNSHLPAIVLRPGAFYGPMGEYAFNRLFFRDPMRGIIMQVEGGRHITFPAYVPDVAQGILAALLYGRVGERYNICGDWMTHREVYDIVCELARIRYPRLRLPGKSGLYAGYLLEAIWDILGREPFWPVNLLRSYVYNDWRVVSDKAKNELGFTPTDFRDGARETVAWYKAGKPRAWRSLEC